MGTMRITTLFTDKALMNGSAANIQTWLESAESSFSACNAALSNADMSELAYQFQADAISELTLGNTRLQTYVGSAHLQVEQELDRPLYLDFKDNATETISQIILEDITTDNTFGMEEYYDVADGSSGLVSEIRVKKNLTMRDFLDLPDKVEDIETTPLKNVETVSVFTSLFRQDYETMIASGMDIDDCVQAYMTNGEFNHKEYHPVRDVISGVLDNVFIKPLVDCIVGYDIITFERLDDAERAMKLVDTEMAIFSFAKVLKGLKSAGFAGKRLIVEVGKEYAQDAISDLAAETADHIGTELEMPAEATWLLSVAAGSVASKKTGEFLRFNSSGDNIEMTYEEAVEAIQKQANSDGLAIQKKLNSLLNSDYYKDYPGYDCSEIAADFYDAAGKQGKIYRIEGKNGYINGYEYGYKEAYIYHEVYSDGTYIYDSRYTNVPVLKDDYFRKLREINPDGFDVFEKMDLD